MTLPVPALQAVKTSVGLLVDGEYETFWNMTGKVGRPEDVERAVVQYGRTLTFPPDSEWVDVPNVHEGVADGKQVYDVDYPLWTKEEGRSDLELSLTLTEVMEGIYDIRYRDLRVP